MVRDLPLSCCWGCCPMQFRDTCVREGVVITCHHVSVTVPGVSVAPCGPLSLFLAANSWLPEPLPCCHMFESMLNAGMKSNTGKIYAIFSPQFVLLLFLYKSLYVFLLCCAGCSHQLISNRCCGSGSRAQRLNNSIPCKSAVLILAVEG